MTIGQQLVDQSKIRDQRYLTKKTTSYRIVILCVYGFWSASTILIM